MKRSTSILAAGLLTAAVAPFFLHRRFRVVQRVRILEAPAGVFPYVADLKNWPLWAPWITGANVEFSEQTSGAGAWLRWESTLGMNEVRVSHLLPDQRVAVSIRVGGRYDLDGIISLENLDAATRVTVVATWPVAENPLARYCDLALRLQLVRDFKLALDWLRALVECKPTL